MASGWWISPKLYIFLIYSGSPLHLILVFKKTIFFRKVHFTFFYLSHMSVFPTFLVKLMWPYPLGLNTKFLLFLPIFGTSENLGSQFQSFFLFFFLDNYWRPSPLVFLFLSCCSQNLMLPYAGNKELDRESKRRVFQPWYHYELTAQNSSSVACVHICKAHGWG